MRKEHFEEVRDLMISFVLVFIAFKIAFFRWDSFGILKMVASLFWLFVLPGYVLLRIYGERFSFIERLTASTLLSAAFIGIASYYAGLLGFPIWYHHLALPGVIISIGIFLNLEIRVKPTNKTISE